MKSPVCEGELMEAHAVGIKKEILKSGGVPHQWQTAALSRSGLASLSSTGFHLALLLTAASVNNKSLSGCVGGIFI